MATSVSKVLRPKVLALGVLGLVFASSTYGFAAANTVPANNAGDGSNAISGYTVGAVKYTLNATDPGVIDSVAFTLTGSAKPDTVKARLTTSGAYANCTTSSTASPYAYSCPVTGQATATASDLRVVAAS